MQDVNKNNDGPSILTLQNLADYLRVHPSTIYRLLKRKELPAFKVGRDWRFNRESIDRWCTEAELNEHQLADRNGFRGGDSARNGNADVIIRTGSSRNPAQPK